MAGSFSQAYSSAFDIEPVAYVTINWTGSVDDHPRPHWPPYSPLWIHYHFPETQTALLLFRSGAVIETDTLQVELADQADEIIFGGYIWYDLADSWQAQVLADNGYAVVPYAGPIAPREASA
jgi:hypothetical protein